MSTTAEAEGAGLRGGQASRTAMMAALGRGLHRFNDDPPWILDDPYALPLIGPGWADLHATLLQAVREPVVRELFTMGAVRSRYAEDRLLRGRFTQYVALGAGLDSLAWRRPDLLRTLRMFEVDHPSTQQWKRARVAALALPHHDGHVFAPVDFETATLHEGLTAAGFDWSQPTLYSWLGVTMYIPLEAVEATLRTVAGTAPGSEIVMGYIPSEPFVHGTGAEFLEVGKRFAAQLGEPWLTFLSPADAETLAENCGLAVSENVNSDDLHKRYCAGRADGITPCSLERYLTASVGAAAT